MHLVLRMYGGGIPHHDLLQGKGLEGKLPCIPARQQACSLAGLLAALGLKGPGPVQGFLNSFPHFPLV